MERLARAAVQEDAGRRLGGGCAPLKLCHDAATVRADTTGNWTRIVIVGGVGEGGELDNVECELCSSCDAVWCLDDIRKLYVYMR